MLEQNPFQTPPPYEKLLGDLSGAYSRRLNIQLLALALGAASNVASALLLEPSVAGRVTVMFHGRSEETSPERSTQFNIMGDIIAARHLLESRAPLIWFDTGTNLVAPMSETETRFAPAGRLGTF